MARIGTYATDTDVTGSDKVLGTDSANSTKNYTLNSIGEYFSKNNVVSVAGQIVFKFNTSLSDHGAGSFMTSSTGNGGGNDLDTITTLIIHKELSDGTNAEKLIKKIFNSGVRIFGVDSVNAHCSYNVVSVADHETLVDTLQITLAGANGEGTIVADEFYAIASTEGDDKSYTHNQGVASATWNIQHNMGKKPSVTIVDSAENYVVGEIEYVDNNNLTVTFSGAFSGKAYLN